MRCWQVSGLEGKRLARDGPVGLPWAQEVRVVGSGSPLTGTFALVGAQPLSRVLFASRKQLLLQLR
jgi:hypothetical protein